MAQQTTKFKQTLSGSVGAGMGALVNPNSRRYYILEHKVSSQYHKAGESQEIIVDEVELGRDPKCQVRFDESFGTVSRHHAAIVRDGDKWKLVQLSKTNTTFLNGHPVRNEWYLQSGDEIQLSTNGPKLLFIVPQGKQALVSSIGFTRRLSLFRQQALRPYKTALWSMAAVLVVAIAGLTWWNLEQRSDFIEQGEILAEQIKLAEKNEAKADSLSQALKAMTKQVAAANARAQKALKSLNTVGVGGQKGELTELAKDIYYCIFSIQIAHSKKVIAAWSGTAFLLNDGRLVTAQHVVNPLMGAKPTTDEEQWLNGMFNTVPENFICLFEAVSPKGDKISYQYRMDRPFFHVGAFSPRTLGTYRYKDMSLTVKYIPECDDRDYAWVQTEKKGALVADAAFSKSMPVKTHLDIMGFPKSVGAENVDHVSPIYSESSVAREGLDVDGCILLSNSETDHGNSGGPVFAVKDGKYVVVGILSGSDPLGSKTDPLNRGGIWKDRVVPISAIN